APSPALPAANVLPAQKSSPLPPPSPASAPRQKSRSESLPAHPADHPVSAPLLLPLPPASTMPSGLPSRSPSAASPPTPRSFPAPCTPVKASAMSASTPPAFHARLLFYPRRTPLAASVP